MDDDLSVSAGGTAADRAERLTRSMRDQSFPNVKPRDSATLILVDNTAAVPKVLLGRRHQRHRFLPGKFVFPGGGVDRRALARPEAQGAAVHPRLGEAPRRDGDPHERRDRGARHCERGQGIG